MQLKKYTEQWKSLRIVLASCQYYYETEIEKEFGCVSQHRIIFI